MEVSSVWNRARANDKSGAKITGELSPRAIEILFKISMVLTVSIFLLVSLGGLVRSAGAGLSCPDWPLCHGQVIPDQMFADGLHKTNEAIIPGAAVSPVPAHATAVQIFLEWFHRLIAGTVSICLLLISTITLSNPKLRKTIGKACLLAVTLLAAQIVLGGLTVLGLLSPKWVASHLAVGIAFFCTNLWITMELRQLSGRAKQYVDTFPGSKQFYALSVATLAIVYGQILLGGMVSSNYAGLACPDFPTCNGELIPPFEGFVRFQFMHRVGFVVTTLAIVLFAFKAMKRAMTPLSRTAARMLPGLLMIQISLGVGMIWYKIPLLMSVGHLFVATAMIASLTMVVHEVRNTRRV